MKKLYHIADADEGRDVGRMAYVVVLGDNCRDADGVHLIIVATYPSRRTTESGAIGPATFPRRHSSTLLSPRSAAFLNIAVAL